MSNLDNSSIHQSNNLFTSSLLGQSGIRNPEIPIEFYKEYQHPGKFIYYIKVNDSTTIKQIDTRLKYDYQVNKQKLLGKWVVDEKIKNGYVGNFNMNNFNVNSVRKIQHVQRVNNKQNVTHLLWKNQQNYQIEKPRTQHIIKCVSPRVNFIHGENQPNLVSIPATNIPPTITMIKQPSVIVNQPQQQLIFLRQKLKQYQNLHILNQKTISSYTQRIHQLQKQLKQKSSLKILQQSNKLQCSSCIQLSKRINLLLKQITELTNQLNGFKEEKLFEKAQKPVEKLSASKLQRSEKSSSSKLQKLQKLQKSDSLLIENQLLKLKSHYEQRIKIYDFEMSQYRNQFERLSQFQNKFYKIEKYAQILKENNEKLNEKIYEINQQMCNSKSRSRIHILNDDENMQLNQSMIRIREENELLKKQIQQIQQLSQNKINELMINNQELFIQVVSVKQNQNTQQLHYQKYMEQYQKTIHFMNQQITSLRQALTQKEKQYTKDFPFEQRDSYNQVIKDLDFKLWQQTKKNEQLQQQINNLRSTEVQKKFK